MTSQPAWDSVDNYTSDLLALVADDGTIGRDEEWRRFVQHLESASIISGVINPNFLRRLVRGNIAPRRIGAFTRRAVLDGLVEYTGKWVVSDDTEGKNAGKPCRELRWIGGAS